MDQDRHKDIQHQVLWRSYGHCVQRENADGVDAARGGRAANTGGDNRGRAAQNDGNNRGHPNRGRPSYQTRYVWYRPRK